MQVALRCGNGSQETSLPFSGEAFRFDRKIKADIQSNAAAGDSAETAKILPRATWIV